ncbi:class I SAM-dependent methyltransferase [Haloplanus salinus]|jgi:2-polyprenyl-3-methyl-5-hydroxy-6-metoxy-1,4-benzoquinol methylase|uniref:Class I SAM-dependent methyltransferase n=1 Tax=Haloplanus salinus TaxID=1126245 RepID=A0A368NEB6_9EURY|nr:class I SAM-dependent methyltransferase [Haloplanus salinus]RCU48005.1 class I SAM-dependent methyltransferase [Haloplanus salinus]
MSPDVADDEQQIQEAQYDYPYHYIPRVEDGRFSQLQYWSWGMHYLGGMRVVIDQLEPWSFDSLIDVGCGDGRFLRELAAERPSVDSLGIDYSERSIAMARGMNPDVDYEVVDLLSDEVGREFDVATAVEVLEHIPPDDLRAFVSRIADLLADDGRFVLTVPHENKPVQDKHYQHFSAADLESLLTPRFEIVEFVPFDKQSKVFTALELALGGRGRHFVVNSPPVVDTLWTLYRRRYLYADSESNCRRIAAVCRR